MSTTAITSNTHIMLPSWLSKTIRSGRKGRGHLRLAENSNQQCKKAKGDCDERHRYNIPHGPSPPV